MVSVEGYVVTQGETSQEEDILFKELGRIYNEPLSIRHNNYRLLIDEMDVVNTVNAIALEALSKIYGIDPNIMEVSNYSIHEGDLEEQDLFPLYIVRAYPVSDNTTSYVVIYSEPHGKIIEIRNFLLALQSIEQREVVYNQSELEEVMEDDYNIVSAEIINENNFHAIDIKLTLDNEDSYLVHLEYPDKTLRV